MLMTSMLLSVVLLTRFGLPAPGQVGTSVCSLPLGNFTDYTCTFPTVDTANSFLTGQLCLVVATSANPTGGPMCQLPPFLTCLLASFLPCSLPSPPPASCTATRTPARTRTP
jgi:hypothetical protein